MHVKITPQTLNFPGARNLDRCAGLIDLDHRHSAVVAFDGYVCRCVYRLHVQKMALAAKMPEQSAAKEAEDGYASDDDETEQEEEEEEEPTQIGRVAPHCAGPSNAAMPPTTDHSDACRNTETHPKETEDSFPDAAALNSPSAGAQGKETAAVSTDEWRTIKRRRPSSPMPQCSRSPLCTKRNKHVGACNKGNRCPRGTFCDLPRDHPGMCNQNHFLPDDPGMFDF